MARILVIDDDEQVRRLLCTLIDRMGHTAIPAANGLEGTKLFNAAPCAIVITDIFMPEKEGLEMILELKRGYPQVRIIAISGGGQTRDLGFLQTAAILGADVSLSKPIDPGVLVEKIQQLCQDLAPA